MKFAQPKGPHHCLPGKPVPGDMIFERFRPFDHDSYNPGKVYNAWSTMLDLLRGSQS